MSDVYRVVIIDDEPIILRGLSETVPWAKHGCEVVGTARDGQEGLAMIRRLRPHMIFSDIYMPKMDGLTMAAAMKSEYEDTELTILTGYRDFELAQQSIRLGVTRFLVKPSNMEELEEAVAAMAARLRKKGITGGKSDPEECTESVSNETADAFLVKKALDYMRENYRQKVTLTDVAESVYVSSYHMGRLLKRHTGKSFSELMNSIRIEEMKKASNAMETDIPGAEKKLPDDYQYAGRKQEYVVDRLKEYIESHLDGNLSRKELSGVVYLSEDYLSKIFAAATGMPLSGYVSSRRIARAQQLLAETDLTVSQIALRVGFSNFSYFSKIFRELTGKTPNEYRESVNNPHLA